MKFSNFQNPFSTIMKVAYGTGILTYVPQPQVLSDYYHTTVSPHIITKTNIYLKNKLIVTYPKQK
jgi:hypothetical protein